MALGFSSTVLCSVGLALLFSSLSTRNAAALAAFYIKLMSDPHHVSRSDSHTE